MNNQSGLYLHSKFNLLLTNIFYFVSPQLLFPQQPEQLNNMPTMCAQYIVLGICEDWQKPQLEEIQRMITHQTLEISIIKEVCALNGNFKFLTIFVFFFIV